MSVCHHLEEESDKGMYTEQVRDGSYLLGSGLDYHGDLIPWVSGGQAATLHRGAAESPWSPDRTSRGDRAAAAFWLSHPPKCVKTAIDAAVNGAAALPVSGPRLDRHPGSTSPAPTVWEVEASWQPLSISPFLSTLPLSFSPHPCFCPPPHTKWRKSQRTWLKLMSWIRHLSFIIFLFFSLSLLLPLSLVTQGSQPPEPPRHTS